MNAHELELRAEVFGRATGRARARVRDFDRGDRLRRALGIGLPLFAGALASLPIPGWHFAGVPGFTIAAVFFFVRRLRQPRTVDAVDGPCPACGDSIRYPLAETTRFPETCPCPSCGEFVKLAEAR